MSRCAASLGCSLEGPRRGVAPASGGPARPWARRREKFEAFLICPILHKSWTPLLTFCHILLLFSLFFFSCFGQFSHPRKFSPRLAMGGANFLHKRLLSTKDVHMMGIITLEDVIEKLIQDGMLSSWLTYHWLAISCHPFTIGFVHLGLAQLQENIEDESDTLERTCTLRSALTFAICIHIIHCHTYACFLMNLTETFRSQWPFRRLGSAFIFIFLLSI